MATTTNNSSILANFPSLMLPNFPSFDCEADVSSIGQRWKKYAQRFENFLIATDVTDDKRKRALLMHYVGDAVCDIFDILNVTDQSYNAAISALNDHFTPLQNSEYETYLFRQTKQEGNETLEQFTTRLRKAAFKCNFTDREREIKSQIVVGCQSSKLRRYALLKPELNLTEIMNYGRATELSEKHTAEIETHCKAEVNWIRPNKGTEQKQHFQKTREPQQGFDQTQKTMVSRKCKNCGQAWHLNGREHCRARNVTCHACNKTGHYAKMCLSTSNRSRPTYPPRPTFNPRKNFAVAQVIDDVPHVAKDDDFVYANYEKTTDARGKQNKPGKQNEPGTTTLNLLGSLTKVLIDSGATVNILSEQDYKKITPGPILESTTRIIYPYGRELPLDILGQFTTSIEHKNRWHEITFHVSRGIGPSLISKQTSLELDLIRFVDIVTAENKTENYKKYIENKFPLLTQGIGKLRNSKIKLHINSNVMPVANKYRRLPFHIRDKVEAELKRLQALDIIEKIPESAPTPWISPVVIVPPKNDPDNIRICIDMREPNMAIQRERHVSPTLDDILYELNKAAVFSKLDLNQGYHQLEIDEDSRYITTFATHTGLFRYKRLNFGINAASEIFQYEINKVIRDIPGTINISDDILIFGKDQQQHDRALEQTLSALNTAGLTINKEKCKFAKSNLNFFGHIFSRDGISADPNKIVDIINAKTPENATEARSLLGTLNFCARYIPNLAIISKPIRDLTKKDSKWQWSTVHQTALNKILTEISKNIKLVYFNKKHATEIWTDASPYGLGAILVQRDEQSLPQIIAFGSRALTDTESRYSQIEREALGITWAVEHFELYVYGGDFVIYTDHKPLVSLFNNPRAKLSTRLERWRLRLQQYSFQVRYKEGINNPADYLSRHPRQESTTSKTERRAEEYIQFIGTHTTPKHLSIEEVSKQTLRDPTLQQVIRSIQTGDWRTREDTMNIEHLKTFHKLRNELSTNTTASILFKGHKMVLPAALQDQAIDIAHTGHQGIVKTKQLLRSKNWFPGIDGKVQEKLKHCLPCHVATDVKVSLPLHVSEMPDQPWNCLHIDHKGPLPQGEYLLVIMDLYSRFPIVETVRSTGTKENIGKLDNIFAMFGFPATVCTDNGPPFCGAEFTKFLTDHGVHHRKITPAWPQANGEVERFNRTLSKSLRIAFEFHQDWKTHLNDLLRAYRATPHSVTRIAPAELMFNRPINIGLPIHMDIPLAASISRERLKASDTLAKNSSKAYYDEKHRQMKNIPSIGDTVLVRQTQKTKMSTPYAPIPYVVKDVKGAAITSERPGHTITRHASHFKIIPPEGLPTSIDIEDETVPPDRPESPQKGRDIERNNLPTPGPPLTGYQLRKTVQAPKRLITEI